MIDKDGDFFFLILVGDFFFLFKNGFLTHMSVINGRNVMCEKY